MLALGCIIAFAANLSAAQSAAAPASTNTLAKITATNTPSFSVQAYVLKYNPMVFTNAPELALSGYAGTNVSLERIIQVASGILLEFQKRGYTKANISISQEQITNGIVTLNVFQGVFPQVLVSGKTSFRPGEPGIVPLLVGSATNTNTPAKTNIVQRFNVQAYEITGDTLLSTNTLMSIFAKATGTNIALTNILQAATDLAQEYRRRGYPTVSVTLPPQQITNAVVKIRVFEGVLSEIRVTKNHYFSSNNIMRSLPSLHTNMILVQPVFQAELDRANANQDRQIYPQLEPGAEPTTTALVLGVEDRLPLHGKIEFNNQNSPGTPDLRVNSSAVYNNLWQLDHSLGVQYSFSPEKYKQGDSWSFYDRPLVANYGAFYRLPLGDFNGVDDTMAKTPGNFGYDEATRKFRLPTPSGRPELNFFASRSTIDTGILTPFDQQIFASTNGSTLVRKDTQEDLTYNSDLGARLSIPLEPREKFQSGISGGFDFKTYQLISSKTNNYFLGTQILTYRSGNLPPDVSNFLSTVTSPVPLTNRKLNYLPLGIRYDASFRDSLGTTSLGLGLNVNAWHSGTRSDLQAISGSEKSSGYWVTLNPNISRDFPIHTNWNLSLRAAGQWANEPLISNEQFGVGGLNSVRGYHEGEVFGDDGWYVSLEQKTAPCLIGPVYARHPLTVRGSVYMDYGEAYLIDPQSRARRTSLWGTGVGGIATIGANWEFRVLFSWALLNAGTTQSGEPRFDFSLTAQF